MPNFPESYLPLAKAMYESLNLLRTKNNVNWTYISPAAKFIVQGPTLGKYTLKGEEFTTDEQGHSKTSYVDYALGVVDEIIYPTAKQSRISLHW